MFRASSVIFALQQSSAEVIGHEYVRCPLDLCNETPEICQKGTAHECIKEVVVMYTHDNHNKEVKLRFFFTISSVDLDGSIDENNKFLQILVRRNIIDQTLLARV